MQEWFLPGPGLKLFGSRKEAEKRTVRHLRNVRKATAAPHICPYCLRPRKGKHASLCIYPELEIKPKAYRSPALERASSIKDWPPQYQASW